MTTEPTTGQVVGENVRRLREQRRLTQHETVRLLRSVGLSLSQSRIAAIERGDRASVDVGVLLLLCRAFSVAPSELFAGAGAVRLSAGATQSRAGIRQMLTGPDWRQLEPEDQPKPARTSNAAVEADRTLADRLDVPTEVVARIATELWGRSLTEERDRRVDALGEMEPNERQAHRGHVTRELAQEIERLVVGNE